MHVLNHIPEHRGSLGDELPLVPQCKKMFQICFAFAKHRSRQMMGNRVTVDEQFLDDSGCRRPQAINQA